MIKLSLPVRLIAKASNPGIPGVAFNMPSTTKTTDNQKTIWVAVVFVVLAALFISDTLLVLFQQTQKTQNDTTQLTNNSHLSSTNLSTMARPPTPLRPCMTDPDAHLFNHMRDPGINTYMNADQQIQIAPTSLAGIK